MNHLKNLNYTFLLLFFFLIAVFKPAPGLAQQNSGMDPKTKAFLIVCGYGTVGGGLLGLASMAFGAKSKAIAQGASLGLYSGILFGAYILMTHDDPYGSSVEDQSAPFDQPYNPYVPDDSSSMNHRFINQNSSELQKYASSYQVGWSWRF